MSQMFDHLYVLQEVAMAPADATCHLIGQWINGKARKAGLMYPMQLCSGKKVTHSVNLLTKLADLFVGMRKSLAVLTYVLKNFVELEDGKQENK